MSTPLESLKQQGGGRKLTLADFPPGYDLVVAGTAKDGDLYFRRDRWSWAAVPEYAVGKVFSEFDVLVTPTVPEQAAATSAEEEIARLKQQLAAAESALAAEQAVSGQLRAALAEIEKDSDCGYGANATLERINMTASHAIALTPADALTPVQELVRRFSAALLEKLEAAERKYGYNDAWQKDDWQPDLLRELVKHVEKGDPRDVAAYCAFAWHHGWSLSDALKQRLLEVAELAFTEAYDWGKLDEAWPQYALRWAKSNIRRALESGAE